MYQTPLPSAMLVIDDASPEPVFVGPDRVKRERGYVPRDWSVDPFGGFAAPLDVPPIPRDEWLDRIEGMDQIGSDIDLVCEQAGLDVLDQDGTNYCWVNATTHCVEMVQVLMGQPIVRLSPASVGSKIKNFRNVGGWGTQALKYMAEHGIVPQDLWPPNAIDRRYDVVEAWEAAKPYQVLEWWDIPGNDLEAVMSVLLRGIPISGGFNWWSHQVTLARPVVLPGRKIGIKIRNSWGTGWGDHGRGVLTDRKMIPDDACAPRVHLPA